MTLATVSKLAEPAGLFIMGGFHTDGNTLVLLGAGKACWPSFKRAQEYSDGLPDPLDRWSKRIIGGIADKLGADDSYPSDGPPYAPFIDWALQTRRFFQSPTGMMVHDKAGLMISIRGALRFQGTLTLDQALSKNPCYTCVARPCVSACPVDALSESHPYDVPVCKSFLDTREGQDCMANGCKVRRACPVSIQFERSAEQSAFHMISFKG